MLCMYVYIYIYIHMYMMYFIHLTHAYQHIIRRPHSCARGDTPIVI